jgi:hypothetical protein
MERSFTVPLTRKPPAGNVRRVQSNGRNLRYTLTNKAGNLVQCESYQERKLALLLERDQTVRDYGSQPEKLSWFDDHGKPHTCVPDFIVWRVDGQTELHEVTLTLRQSHPQQQRRQQAAPRICGERGWNYVVHTEVTLPNETVTANLLVLHAHRSRSCFHPAVQHTAVSELQSTALPVRQLLLQLTEKLDLPLPTLYMALLHLLWHGVLDTDLNRLVFRDGSLLPDIRIGVKGGAS